MNRDFLNPEDKQELLNSGFNEDWIDFCEAKSTTLNEAIEYGFKAMIDDQELLIMENVNGCLLLPFFDIYKKEIIDINTRKKISVIKPRYTELAKAKFKNLPKYLCLPKSLQSRQHIHFPKCFDWEAYLAKETIKSIYITEGWKKAEAACSQGIPTICVWSIYCFNESGMASPLIPELKDLIQRQDCEIVLIWDSDKTIKDGVMKAEYSFVDKVYKETKKHIKVLDLPQTFAGRETKGLDDFLVIGGKQEFLKLKPRTSYTPFIGSKTNQIPLIPKVYLPELYKMTIDEIDLGYEGCLEIAPMALFCQGAVSLGNTFTLQNKKANIYAIGISPTTSGKSAISRQILKPIFAINQELETDYHTELAKEDGCKAKSKQILISGFTEEGLGKLFSDILEKPVIMSFESEEFDNFLLKFNRDYNSSLSSFITKIFDAEFVSPSITKESLTKGIKPITLKNPTFTFAGVATEVGLINALPKDSSYSGFDNRFIKFIGRQRIGKCVVKPKSLTPNLIEKLGDTLRLPLYHSHYSKQIVNYELSKEAEELYSNIYIINKKWEDENPKNFLVPYYRRIICDYAFKLALQFEVISTAEGIVINSYKDDHWKLFNQYLARSSFLISYQSMSYALEWCKYFMETARYFNENFIEKDPKFEDKLHKAVDLLKQYPKGLNLRLLRRELALTNKKDLDTFESIIEHLKEFNEVLIEEGKNNSKIIKLKPHLS